MRVLESIAEEGPCREQRDVLEFELCMVGLQVLLLSQLLYCCNCMIHCCYTFIAAIVHMS
jgi:hypothetical protein